MGLDMYLNKRTYVQRWEHNPEETKYEVLVTKGGMPTHIQSERVTYVTEEIMYWRKANHIHNWFVQLNGGVDECEEQAVSIENLEILIEACEKIGKYLDIADEDGVPEYVKLVLDETLPTADGFFFGDVNYNVYHIEDCVQTAEKLKAVLAEEGARDSEYFYRASW